MLEPALHTLSRQDLDRAFDSVGAASWAWLRRKRIFLTGGTGFVGKWILSTLLDADRRLALGCRVVMLSRAPGTFTKAFPELASHPAVECVEGDVRNFSIDAGRCDLVIHAAADVAMRTKPLAIFDACVEGTRRVVEFAAVHGADRVLIVSSGAVYGDQPAELAALGEGYPGAPRTTDFCAGYGQGKRAAEWLAIACGNEHGLDVRIARCFAFVGPYQPLDGPFAIANFLQNALQQRPIVVDSDGTALRTYLHASDMTAWLWAIALRAAPGSVYNVGGQQVVSVGDLAYRIARLLGSREAVTLLRKPVTGLAPLRYVPDVGKAIAELEVPPPLDLDDAILRTADWHRARPGAADRPRF